MSLKTVDYDEYWRSKKGNELGLSNQFQLYRASWISQFLEEKDSVLDIGCGDGSVLFEILKRKKINPYGADVSKEALKILEMKEIPNYHIDFEDPHSLDGLPSTDYILLLEILEHLYQPEKILLLAHNKVSKGIFFSIPNTGYIQDRLRLLFGRFPLQWRCHPSEHIRFWTYKDLIWWLDSLNLKSQSQIHLYEGVPIFNKLWPSLFSKAFIVKIDKRRCS